MIVPRGDNHVTCTHQARSSMPSNFDCDLGFALGHTATALVAAGKTGYL